MSDVNVKLLPHHLADLRLSGLSDETIAACGFYSESDPEAVAKLLRWKYPAKALGPCLCIPFINPKNGNLVKGYVRVKPDKPRAGKGKKKGKTNKYESPVGLSSCPYLPHGVIPVLDDSTAELFITEGEKKAAKATQDGFKTIGLVGVYGFQKKRPKGLDCEGSRELIDDLAAVRWSGRTVYIVYDSDAVEKSEVLLAEWHLAETLAATGATVKVIRLPNLADGSKAGIDDYLVTHGTEEFRKLIEAAQDPKKPANEKPNEAPDDPYRLAKGFLETLSPNDGPLLLRSHRDEFFRWSGSYQALPNGDLRGELAEWIRAEFIRLNKIELRKWQEDSGEGSPPEVRKITTGLVANVNLALQGICLLPASINAPAWIEGETGSNPTSILPVQNGLLDLEALAAGQPNCLYPASPHFFSPMVLPFGYDPDAPEPTEWLKFLGMLWPNDKESIDALQEWFGLLLTPDTRQQKILFLLGPKRSGKGTIARVLVSLLGELNFAGPSLGSLATNFGLSPLLGKSVAIISDARLSGRSDAAIITERLLSISGEDAITIDRKHRDPITTKLNTRIVILSNELPRLGDSSGALAGRLILLRLTRTWFGQEDHELSERLQTELPGILLWAIEGWRRLRARKRLLQPTSAAELVEDMENLSSPIGAFVRDRCRVGPGLSVEVRELYNEWRSWCDQNGRKESGTVETFGRDLRAAVPDLLRTRPRDSGKRIHVYTGVRLRDDFDFTAEVIAGHRGHSDQALHVKRENNSEVIEAHIHTPTHRDAMPGHRDHCDQPDREILDVEVF